MHIFRQRFTAGKKSTQNRNRPKRQRSGTLIRDGKAICVREELPQAQNSIGVSRRENSRTGRFLSVWRGYAFPLQLGDGGPQPFRNDGVSFFFRARAIKGIQTLAGFVQRSMTAGKSLLPITIGNEADQRALATRKPLAKISVVRSEEHTS